MLVFEAELRLDIIMVRKLNSFLVWILYYKVDFTFSEPFKIFLKTTI